MEASAWPKSAPIAGKQATDCRPDDPPANPPIQPFTFWLHVFSWRRPTRRAWPMRSCPFSSLPFASLGQPFSLFPFGRLNFTVHNEPRSMSLLTFSPSGRVFHLFRALVSRRSSHERRSIDTHQSRSSTSNWSRPNWPLFPAICSNQDKPSEFFPALVEFILVLPAMMWSINR